MLIAVLMVVCQAAMAQGHRVSGTVTDDFGPVLMANVVEIDDNNRNVNAAVTDVNGNYSIVVKNTKNKLRVSYVGSKTVTKSIGSATKIDFNLTSQTTIKEVTVTAKRKSNAGGLSIPKREMSMATQTMDFSEVEGLAFTSADEALQGKIAGLDIVAGSGNLGAGTQMRLRGVTTINGNKNPLIVVDEQIFDAPDFDPENATEEDYAALLSVNVDDIASIDVLKDAASTAIWGSRGANGVISIKTKRGARGKTKVAYSYKFSGYWQPSSYNLLNGDQYTMLMKEELYNPKQANNATTDVYELNYDKNGHPGDWENWNNNTDWVDAVTQFGTGHDHNLNISGGGQKANFRISAGYLYQTGTIIKQTMNRFTSRLALDYFVSDRIKFMTTFAFTYTNNNKNYKDLLGIAQKLAPNMSIYRQDADGNDTHEYYVMNPYSGVKNPSSRELSSVYALGNPVAIANLAWKKENVYRVNPDFKIQYELLGRDDEKSRLTYTGDVYFDITAKSNPEYAPAEMIKATWDNGEYNRAYNYEFNSMGITFKNELVFRPYFTNKDWSAQVLARYEMYTSNSSVQYETDRTVPTGLEISTLGANMLDGGTTSSTGKGRSQSAIFNMHASYKSKYSIGASLRADGNSKFGPKNKWAYFPSLSARWNIIDEPFMKWSRSVVSMLAFRPSWGIVGNAPSSESLFYELYSQNGYYGTNIGGGSTMQAYTIARMKLDDLKWETTNSYNLGFNLGLFDDKIEAELEYYHKKTTDMLMRDVQTPSTSGYSSMAYINGGSMTNDGWELNVTLNNIIKKGKFSMSANFNVSQNYNELIDMDPVILGTLNKAWVNSNGQYQNYAQLHNTLGSIYGYRYQGVYQWSYEGAQNEYAKVQKYAKDNGQYITPDDFYNQWTHGTLPDWAANALQNPNRPADQQLYQGGKNRTAPFALDENGNVLMNPDGTPKHMVFDYDGVNYEFKGGDAIYEDINHDGEINRYDVMYLGNSMPKVNGGFGFTFKYDRWTLRTSFNYRFGVHVVNMARMELEKMSSTNNQTGTVNWRWRKDGDDTMIPRALYGDNTAYNWLGSDRFVEDASFVRFQYVQLTWDAPKKWVKNVGISNLKIYLSVNNLYCWTKYSGADPEHSISGYSYASDNAKTPRSKYFTLGINLGL